MICAYCGRMKKHCRCEEAESALWRFFQRSQHKTWAAPLLRETPYTRAVPPQIKRRERAVLRQHYRVWMTALAEQYGEVCLNCGVVEDLVIDHIVPLAKGGKSQLDNLQLLCPICNALKGKLVIDCRPAAIDSPKSDTGSS